MKRYNITAPKKYIKNEEEKTAWNRVGTLVEFEATSEKPKGFILELNMFPETKFAVFEDKPREDNSEKQANNEFNQIGESDTETIDPDSIPF